MIFELKQDKLIVDNIEIELDNIHSITCIKNTLKFNLVKKSKILFFESDEQANDCLSRLETMLEEKCNFIRCDRYLILNLNKITKFSVVQTDKVDTFEGFFSF